MSRAPTGRPARIDHPSIWPFLEGNFCLHVYHRRTGNSARAPGAVRKLVHLIREERPQVMLTYDEQGNYGHPDHVRAHELTVAARSAAADPRRFSGAGPPWAVPRLYFVVFGRSAVARFNRALADAGIAAPVSALSGADAGPDAPPFGVDDARISHAVDVSDYLETRRMALAAHRTQMAGHWLLEMPMELAREVWSHETYQRADLVAGSREGPPASDLFEGL